MTRWPTASRKNDPLRGGFTLLEMVVVIVIMGILFTVALPSLGGLSPKYRLRAGAREVGAKISYIRSLSGGTGKVYGLHYDLEKGAYWLVFPPGKEDDPDLALEDRERGVRVELPTLVRFDEIHLADGTVVTNGEIDLEIDAAGNTGSHIVYLRNNEDTLIAVKFNSLLGFVDFYNEEVKFERYL